MKKLAIILLLFTIVQSNSQSFQESIEISGGIPPLKNSSGFSDAMIETLRGNFREWSKIMSSFGEFDDIEFNKRGLDGTVYLFDKWENNGVIEVENKRYEFSNINFNINKDLFMTKIEGDSTFIFDMLSIDKLSVNGRQFTSVYSPGENNRVYEVLYQDQKRSLLKGYFVNYIEASPNPMVNRSRNKIKQGHSYFIYENGKLLPFRLKKSTTLDLVSVDQSKELEKYIKSKNLSYRKENDMTKIFEYISKI